MQKVNKIIKYLLLIIIAVIVMFPIVYMVTNSFMSMSEVNIYYPLDEINKSKEFINLHIIPDSITFNQYYNVFFRNPEFLDKFWNSIKIVCPIIIGQLIVIIPASFVFAKFKIPYKNIIYFAIIILMMMPLQVTLVPNYIVLDKLNLIGKNLSLILPNIFSCMSLVLLTQYIKSIPNEQLEAATVDGANLFIILFKIIIPQSKGAIVTMIILSFAECWNMIEQPMIFLRDKNKFPLSAYLSTINSSDIGLAFACGIIYMIPAIIIFLLGEKYLIDGMKHLQIK